MEESAQNLTPTNKPKDKLIGYLMLIIGLLIIILTVIWAIYTLTGKIKPPQVFNVEAPSITLPTSNLSVDTSSLPAEIAGTIKQNQAKAAPFKILPDNVFSNMLNLGIFYLLAMFIASTGTKIASLGIQLIRDIKVDFKS